MGIFMQLPLSIRALEGLRFCRTSGDGIWWNDARGGCGPPSKTFHLRFGSTQNAANMSELRHGVARAAWDRPGATIRTALYSCQAKGRRPPGTPRPQQKPHIRYARVFGRL